MARPINVWMPEGLAVGPTYTLRVTAISPTDGSVVAGVRVTQVVIEASGEGDLSSGNFVVGNPLLIGVNV